MPFLNGLAVDGSSLCRCGHEYRAHTHELRGPCRQYGVPCECSSFHWPLGGPGAPISWPNGVYSNGLPRRLPCSTCGASSGSHDYDPPYRLRTGLSAAAPRYGTPCPGFSYPGFVAPPATPPEPAFDFAAAVVEGADDEELRKTLDSALDGVLDPL